MVGYVFLKSFGFNNTDPSIARASE
jgi:hypothetical protein